MASEYFTLSNSISISAKTCVKPNLCKLVTTTGSIRFQSPFLKYFSQNTPDKARLNPLSTDRYTALTERNSIVCLLNYKVHRRKYPGGEKTTKKM